jgi:hypothetical protein
MMDISAGELLAAMLTLFSIQFLGMGGISKQISKINESITALKERLSVMETKCEIKAIK